MKRIALPLLILISFISISVYAEKVKIAKICYVNTNALLKVHPASRNVIKELQETRNKYQNEINSLENEVKNLENKVKNDGPNMSQSELRSLTTKLEAKKEALNDRITKRNNELQEIQRKKLQPVYKQILEDIKKYASSLGYNIVIDSRYVLIGAPDLDITSDLKRIFMNKR